jgi:hypothetical protein
MPANTEPIYTRIGDVQWSGAAVATANTVFDGTGTVQTCFVADATNGGYVDRLVIQSGGTNAATRFTVWVNNGSTNATAANNQLIAQISLAATTTTNTAGLPAYEIPIRMALPAGYKLNWAIATAGTGGWHVTAVGGKY